MKRIYFAAMAALLLMLTGCNMNSLSNGTSALGGVLNGGTVTNVLTSVLGFDKLTKAQLIGTWTYTSPGCAFTSKDLLAKAGGEVVAAEIKQKLQSPYATLGITSGNTSATFTEDGKFTITLNGKAINGTYTYDEANDKLVMKGLILSMTCYTKRSASGISLLFEASKLLNVLQVASALSGNTNMQAIGELSKKYDGVRIGFDMRK
jgi:hypothetical protein